MPKPPGYGEYEELILLCLEASGGTYGPEVLRALQEVGRCSAPGAVWTTLHRLETKGLVRSETTPARAIRGGRERRRWYLTEAGRAALAAAAKCRVEIQGAMAAERPRCPVTAKGGTRCLGDMGHERKHWTAAGWFQQEGDVERSR